jgi:hypothetical protein
VRLPASLLLAGLCVLALDACGDTLQDKPIPHNVLENMIEAPYPVYWLGVSFKGMEVTEATRDPGAAYTVQYGNCLRGGQGTCIPPVRIVTSPDNGFTPGGSTPARTMSIRGASATVAQAGRTIAIPTSGVIVNIYARNPQLALAAARTVVPINQVGAPEAPLPARIPDTGFGTTPLPSQIPAPLQPLS